MWDTEYEKNKAAYWEVQREVEENTENQMIPVYLTGVLESVERPIETRTAGSSSNISKA